MNPRHKSLWALIIIIIIVLVFLLLKDKPKPVTISPQENPSDLEAAVANIDIPDYSDPQ